MPLRCNDSECPVYKEHGIDADLCQSTPATRARLKGDPCPHAAQALRREAEHYRQLAEMLDKAAEMREEAEERA